jgi:hypothetical protein
MGLRLLLVGIVACLGFDLPARERVEGWTRTGQTWLRGTLDDWNLWSPACDEMCEVDATAPPHAAAPVAGVTDEAFGAVIEEIVAGFEAEDVVVAAQAAKERTLAQSGGECVAEGTGAAIADRPEAQEVAAVVPAPKQETAPSAFEPIEVTDSLWNDPVYVLIRATEAIEQIEAAPAVAVAPIQVAEVVEVVEVAQPPVPAPAPDAEDELDADPPVPASPVAEATVIRVVETGSEGALSAAPPTGIRRLATALRLTGQALEAWGKFLEAPAVVSLRP